MRTNIALPIGAVLALVLAACGHSEGGSTAGAPAAGLPSSDMMAAVPMGSLAGGANRTALAQSIRNPYAGNAQAVAEGATLYIRLNCAGCHAYNAKGNMGPNLTDTYWRYGGLPVDVYKSIADGRAQGMPAWGAALPPQDIWKLVAYIQSLGGMQATDLTPRNQQGKERIAPELQGSPNAAASSTGPLDTDSAPAVDTPSP
ncbi:MAG: c-type cytochrome [Pseudomonadota bacterium]|nr:c-type cytochrome [Pseudomonadota bacterium]